ncbi:MAG: energy-coupling factor transporter transmembrane protein EcfT [Coriobacteriales bacterium]|jgi:energy-coupling factor transport system permease protein|nr:energy-coupling factor transporter transmembrane protein EcfT [Coriobacteriales bacterium]
MNKRDTNDAFAALHPAPCFLFFGFVAVFTVAFMHPVTLGISFACATAYALYLGRGKALRFTLAFLLPIMALAAVLNPAFNHRGATILFYLWTQNPVTAESLIYGVAGALMIGAVIQWFYCYNAIMTSNKLIWLLGRALPALALALSMTLRLVPRYTAQAKRIATARRGLGRRRVLASASAPAASVASSASVSAGTPSGTPAAAVPSKSTPSLIARAKEGLAILSTMTTWALEGAVDTADSMAARGFGTGRRTAYSNYHLSRRDALALAFVALAALACVVLVASGLVSVDFFPRFTTQGTGGWPATALLSLAWTALGAFPLALGLREDAVWRSLRSRI